MREADVLVVYQAPNRNNVTQVPTKTYEYLRGGCPILAIVPPGDNADLVRWHAALHALVTNEDPSCVAAAIRDLLGEAGREPSPAPCPEFVRQYDRKSIAGRIAAIFDAALDRRAGSEPRTAQRDT